MTKIVYNACYGEFDLSQEALERYAELKGFVVLKPHQFDVSGINRDDPALVAAVEELGENANTVFSRLKIIDLPPGTLYRIEGYDGLEAIVKSGDHVWKKA